MMEAMAGLPGSRYPAPKHRGGCAGARRRAPSWRSASPSTTGCCASRRSWVTLPSPPALLPSRVL